MGWYWNHLGVLGLAATLVAWSLAAVIFSARPDRRQNRLLALLLVLEGVMASGGAGLLYLTDDASIAYGAQAVTYVIVPGIILAYLLFLSTIRSPLVRPLRTAPVQWALRIGIVAAPLVAVLNTPRIIAGVAPTYYSQWEGVGGPWSGPMFLGWTAVSLYGLAVAVSAWRRAPRGSAEHARTGSYALAFGARDLAFVWGGLVIGATDSEVLTYWAQTFAPVLVIVYYVLLAYGILRTQLFDIDLRLKWTLRRGTVAGIFLAAFFIVVAVAEQYLQRYGVVAGGVAVGLLLFAFRPLERLADRVADRAMPGVEDTAEYRLVQRHKVYRAAIESAMLDGVVTERERDVLATLQDQLGLSATDARALERDVARSVEAA